MSKEVSKELQRDSKLEKNKDKKDKAKLKAKSLLSGDLLDAYDSDPIRVLMVAILEELQGLKLK